MGVKEAYDEGNTSHNTTTGGSTYGSYIEREGGGVKGVVDEKGQPRPLHSLIGLGNYIIGDDEKLISVASKEADYSRLPPLPMVDADVPSLEKDGSDCPINSVSQCEKIIVKRKRGRGRGRGRGGVQNMFPNVEK